MTLTLSSLMPVARWVTRIAAVAFGCVIYTYLTLPDVRPLRTSNPSSTAFMELRGREAVDAGRKPRRLHRWESYGRISPSVKRAVIVAEDAAFWSHEGIDFDELQISIESGWARGQAVRGASTITQQLAKNLYLSPSRNPVRKFRELIIARRLEAELTKVRIFELYLNVIEWGDGVYGIGAAARAYFGVSAAALGPSQSALLAAAIINPRVLDPAQPTTRLRSRQALILRRMGAVDRPVEAVRVDRDDVPREPVSAPPDDMIAPPESSDDAAAPPDEDAADLLTVPH